MGDVKRSGLLFKAGNYEDKGYSMTPDELRAAVEQFTPVSVDLEHTPTVLSGKLGRVESVALSADGTSLMGTVALPDWLDGLIADGQRKVSCTWDRATKTLSGLALVLNPRIEEAAIFAGFSAATVEAAPGSVTTPPADFAAPRHDTYHGQDALQGVHDMAARSGAICSADNATTHPYPMFAAAHEVKAMQMIHDHAIAHGAKCSAMPKQAAMSAEKEEPVQDEKKFMDHVRAFFTGDPASVKGYNVDVDQQGKVTAFTESPTPAPKVEDSAEFKAMQADNSRLKAEKITGDAASFADGLVRESKLLPAQRDALVAAYIQSAKADAATFAAGDQTPTLDALKALYAAAPAHTFAKELTNIDGVTVFANRQTTAGVDANGLPLNPDTQPPSADRIRHLHSLTPEGRALLDAERKSAK